MHYTGYLASKISRTETSYIYIYIEFSRETNRKWLDDLANEEARGLNLRGENKIRSTGHHVHIMPRQNQLPSHLHSYHHRIPFKFHQCILHIYIYIYMKISQHFNNKKQNSVIKHQIDLINPWSN